MLTLAEMARALGVSMRTVRIWRGHGLLRGHAYTDNGKCLYEPLTPTPRGRPKA
jgi:DNA-binding transcriptional MerR regulator